MHPTPTFLSSYNRTLPRNDVLTKLALAGLRIGLHNNGSHYVLEEESPVDDNGTKGSSRVSESQTERTYHGHTHSYPQRDQGRGCRVQEVCINNWSPWIMSDLPVNRRTTQWVSSEIYGAQAREANAKEGNAFNAYLHFKSEARKENGENH